MNSVEDAVSRSQVMDAAAGDDLKRVIRQVSLQSDDDTSETNIPRLSSELAPTC